MSKTIKSKRRRTRRPDVVQKPRGVIHPRVQKAGPERFGIVSVDCAKARSRWMLADFYGNVLIPPTTVAHNRVGFAMAVELLRQTVESRGLADVLVAVERTGRYHHPIKRAFQAAGFEVRTVHPFTTKQFRLPADPGNKTDDTDLAAIHRAAVNGFALLEPVLDDCWQELQLLIRHRRDWVRKASLLCCQIKEHLHVVLPGYAACFPKLWEHPAALRIALSFPSAEAIEKAQATGLRSLLREHHIRFQERTVVRVLEWAQSATSPPAASPWHQQIAAALDEDRQQKERQITALERHIAARLAGTPYVLLLSIPGINVVSAADFAGEAGPMSNYATSRSITGRAGLYPSRYQSDQVDVPGKLVKCANRSLRYAILQIADNLILCNHYFANLAGKWQQQGQDPRGNRVKIGMRFCRIAFQMLAGGDVFRHPSGQGRSTILQKLVAFHREHETPLDQVLTDLTAATAQIPRAEHAAEAAPLKELLRQSSSRRHGPQRLGDLLPTVLAGLGVNVLQSEESGASDST